MIAVHFCHCISKVQYKNDLSLQEYEELHPVIELNDICQEKLDTEIKIKIYFSANSLYCSRFYKYTPQRAVEKFNPRYY